MIPRLPPWLSRLTRLLLGVLFLLAAWPKLSDPPAFAKALWAYDLFPTWSIRPLALSLPWLEALCGALLVLGFWRRAAARWITLLLLGFILSLSINLVRRHPVDCGCFSLGQAPRSAAERFSDMKADILRDIGMLLLAGLSIPSRRRNTPSLR
nr:MauE/DoxX family redox-associated membrane protein [uncultured Holophaga sp.]